ncbi:flagellar hook-length control protein FliK [Selenomonas sp. GACV-9]|uniref:flagellar hook-length control protein FliK n=1 Tax=Selenomonas sp. GACV-9 TaxID=3158782 RepID=UPI0008F1FDF9|nr:flagellar hook-length control protein FliK [Selenomonas ruminantium]
MNTANVMAVAPQAGAQTKVQANKPVVKSGKSAGKGMESFGDALDKLDQDIKEAMTQTAGKEQGSTADDGDVMEDAPKDPLAAVLAASQQGNETQTQGEEMAEPMPEAKEPATVVDLTAEAEAAFIDKMVQKEDKAADLQSLIPQSAEESQKKQDFLAMLSGQQLKGRDHRASAPTMSEAVEGKPKQAPTLLESQLLKAQQDAASKGAAVPAENILQGSNAQSRTINPQMAPAVQEQQQTPLATQLTAAAPAVQELAKQPAVQQMVLQDPAAKQEARSDKNITELLGDAGFTIEENTETAPIRMDTQQTMRQAGQQAQSNGQQQANAQLVAEDAKTSASVQQLPEEAVGDRAPVDQQPAAGQTVSAFQQSLQESITGTAASKRQDVQQPQTDFDIPRQIIDQARLIRRAEDTQMVIKLHPEHLGELTLKVSVTQNGSVNASFHSDNAQVRAVIENSLVQLRQELNNQGLKVDSVEVYAGLADGQLPQEQGQQAWQDQQGSNASNIRGIAMDAEEYGEEAEALAAAAMQGTAPAASDGVDYRI